MVATYTLHLTPRCLWRWLYPADISIVNGHASTCHNEPWDGLPTRMDGRRFKLGRLLRLHESYGQNRIAPFRGYRRWWYTSKPSAGHVEIYFNHRPLDQLDG